jgi:hypothetical protein
LGSKYTFMKQLSWLLLLFTFSGQAQFQWNGLVKDAKTNQPLPFASITSNTGVQTVSDVDGKFLLTSANPITDFIVSYIGYAPIQQNIIPNKTFYGIVLEEKSNDLNEVIIPNDNDALRIIQQAIANKNNNNPRKKNKSYSFKSYNKLLVTANPDSINGKIDSIFVEKTYGKELIKIDSSNYKFKEIISKQHLFQTEKVSFFQHQNTHLKEVIMGTKMSGFKQPIYEIIAFNLHSFSMYDAKYELFETKYNSPIADDATEHYHYKLLDSVTIDGRSTYMIYFKNKKKKNASGLEGVLYIDTNSYGIAKAIMRIKGVLDISSTHEFAYFPEEKIWFPITKTFQIVKGKNENDIKILGGTIQFDGAEEASFMPRKKEATDISYLRSKSYYFDIQFDKVVDIKQPSIAIEVETNAINPPESFWQTYRKEPLDLRSQKTYSAVDSISIKNGIENKLLFGRKIINGYVPISIIDFDLRKFVSYNNYEGFRIGVGGITNDRFSKKWKIEGYSAYGTKDGTFKYSLGIGSRINKFSNTWWGVSFTDDVREIASTAWAVDKRGFKIYDPRPINISTFYHYQTWKTSVETKFIPKTESIWEISNTFVEPRFDYVYNLNEKLFTKYNLTTAMVSLRWNPFSDYMQTPTGRIETEKRYPKFTFQFTKSLPNVSNNDFEFSKIDFRTEYQKNYLNGQKTSLLFETGYVVGDLPLTHLYNTSPNNLNKETIFQRITFGGKNSFETMFFNEFFSSKFAYFQFKHQFNRIPILKKVKPVLVLVSRMGWGDMEKPEQNVGIDYKTLRDGFFESGIELNQIFNGLGLSGFYRYGPNQLPKFQDNIAVKISFILNLGF